MEDVLYHEKCFMSLASQGKLKVKPREGPAYSLIPTLEEFRIIRAGVGNGAGKGADNAFSDPENL